MAHRRVTQTGKDKDGDITKLCKQGVDWSPRYKSSAIRDIEGNLHSYYVEVGSNKTYVHVVDGPNGKYLRTTADSTASDNLGSLPDC